LIESAIKQTLLERESLTPDLGGVSSASSMTSCIIKRIR
jgi:isocitrate/isopropylmalate dehydrogenase